MYTDGYIGSPSSVLPGYVKVTPRVAEFKIMKKYRGSRRFRSLAVMSRRGRMRLLIASTTRSESKGFEGDRVGNSPSVNPGAKIQLYSRDPNECGCMRRTVGNPGGVSTLRSTVRRPAISEAILRNCANCRGGPPSPSGRGCREAAGEGAQPEE